MAKKTNTLFVVVLFAISIMIPCRASGPTISVGTAEAKPGDTVTLPVRLTDNPGINTFSLEFLYDNTKLTLLDVTPAANIGGQFVYKKKAVWLNGSDTRYNGEVLSLTFRVLSTAEFGKTAVSVAFAPGDISDENENDVAFSIDAGSVSICIAPRTVSRKSIRQALFRIIKIPRAFSVVLSI